ncbi:MAG: carboxypeptidase-like regulatory domain-containing protein [Methanobrevibacter sp.]|uniref:carboxypeptidase-like regulatory domain-containing protein n=1 Tax=Methanobrevibacter sp. TaxID=66852 RepID=UPI0026DF5689|nr:carboxypeptidase-like regulatory domain-containing protein [Methanobrevibacter sp.]MDO5848116.1 carboxypeptidase-like regulatory domain-containing protein [Methanobrevibacter sp.]
MRPHLQGNGGMDVYISVVVTEGNLLNFNDNYWGTNNPLNSTDYPYVWKDRFDTNGKTVILNSWLVKKVETKLVGEDISLFYKNGTKYEVILLDNDGNPISNQDIDITIKNVHYVLVSDKNGSVSLPINLMPGKYDVSVTYKGNDNYYNSTTQNVITVLSLNDDNSSSVDKNDSADDGNTSSVDKNDSADDGNTSSVDNNGSAGNGADSSIKVPTVGNKNWAVGKGVFKNSLKFKNNVNSAFKDIYDVIKIILDAIDSAYASMFAYINETSKGNSTNSVLSFLCLFDWILH